jgi:hypothetical protein
VLGVGVLPVLAAAGAAPAGGVPVGAGTVLVAAGTGAPLPAVSEPKPSFSSDNASIFPVGVRPFLSWNFVIASAVAASHLPLGSPS